MSNSLTGLGAFDPKWGMLIAALHEEGCDVEEIEQAKRTLADVIKNSDSRIPLSEQAKALFAKVYPNNTKELVASVKKEVLAFAGQKIRELSTCAPDQAERICRDLMQPGSYIDEKLRVLRQLGAADLTNSYFSYTFLYHSSEELVRRVEAVVQEVVCDFFEGVPTSFCAMVQLLSTRKMGYTPISHLVSDEVQSFQIVRRLADLALKQAQDCLSEAYHWNSIGSDKQSEALELSLNQRIEGLRSLALAGHAWSQNVLANACCNKTLGHDLMALADNEQRMEYMQELIEHEVPFNYHVQSIISDNKIGDLPYGLTLEKRLALLHERAKQGDDYSFRSLFDAYYNNTLGSDSLELTRAQQFAHLESLRPYNSALLDRLMVHMYLENCFEPKLSDSACIQWLEDQAFNHGNSKAQDEMALAYAQNQLSGYETDNLIPLNMSTQERLRKLKVLADQDCQPAQRTLLKHFQYSPNSAAADFVDTQDPSEQLKGLQLTALITPEDVLRWGLFSFASPARSAVTEGIVNNKIKNAASFLFRICDVMLE